MEELDRSARDLAAAEKKNVARLIAHISEISKRDGDLEGGYPSLFEYCVRRLNLSEGSVWRRIQVANVCRTFPQILLALSENRLNLTVASLLAPHLTENNIERLLGEAEGKTKRQVDEMLVALRPREEFKSSVRKSPLRKGSSTSRSRPVFERFSYGLTGEPRRPDVIVGRDPLGGHVRHVIAVDLCGRQHLELVRVGDRERF